MTLAAEHKRQVLQWETLCQNQHIHVFLAGAQKRRRLVGNGKRPLYFVLLVFALKIKKQEHITVIMRQRKIYSF